MGPRAGRDGGKSRPTGIRSPDRPARSSVAIPTEPPGSLYMDNTAIMPIIFLRICVRGHK